MLPPRTTGKRTTAPAAFRAVAYALSILLVLTTHMAAAELAAAMLA
jgi:hypothetical protein